MNDLKYFFGAFWGKVFVLSTCTSIAQLFLWYMTDYTSTFLFGSFIAWGLAALLSLVFNIFEYKL